MTKTRKVLFTASDVRKSQGTKPISFTTRSTPMKKQSTRRLRDLKKYLIRKEQLEKRYSKSSITFP